METEILRSLVDYDPASGDLIRKVDFSANAKAGTRITCENSAGYIQCVISGEFFYGHRLAWQLHYGSPPPGKIDHKNLNKSDNRIDNLRLASSFQNQQNTPLRKSSKSGFKGVSWLSSRGKWVARVNANGVAYLCKHFSDLEQAIQAVKFARAKAHGEFANHGNKEEMP